VTTTDSLSPDSRYGNVVVVAAELIGPVGARTTDWTFPSWHLSIKISWTGGTESRMQVTQQIKGFECLPKYTTKKLKAHYIQAPFNVYQMCLITDQLQQIVARSNIFCTISLKDRHSLPSAPCCHLVFIYFFEKWVLFY